MKTLLGTNIYNYRKQHDLKQADFAELIANRQCDKCKCDYVKSVSKWESGENFPEMSALIEIAKELNVSLDELLYEEMTNFGVSAIIAKDIVDMEDRHLELLIGLYRLSLMDKLNGKNDRIAFIEAIKYEKDGINFYGVDTSGYTIGVANMLNEPSSTLEYLNYDVHKALEKLEQTSLIINVSDFKADYESETNYSATVTLLNDYNVLCALIDEQARRNKKFMKNRFTSKKD